jgi:hypothetical protein
MSTRIHFLSIAASTIIMSTAADVHGYVQDSTTYPCWTRFESFILEAAGMPNPTL